MIKEWENGESAFQYEKQNGQVKLLQWKGSGISAHIPEQVEGCPVTAIGRKAFLSNKRIQEVWLPKGISQIEEWAFAYCTRLNTVGMPGHKILFGKGAFLQCEKLERIITDAAGDGSAAKADVAAKESADIACLLAATVHKLDAPYLLTPAEAGEEEWLQKWDAKLLQILKAPDREGYSKTILCGEEDYGSMENNLEYFLSQKRRSKVRLALVRLLHDLGLSGEVKQQLESYLKEHTKGCPHEEAWLVVKEEYGVQKEYYDLLYRTEALTRGNFDAILCDMGNELAEMKAYLLKKKEEWFGNGSFFDAFVL